MIAVKAAVPFSICRSHDTDLWGAMLDQRRYVIQTPFERYLVDCDGLRAILALSPGMDRSLFEELDANLNDILDIQGEGHEVEITLDSGRPLYSLDSPTRRIVDSTENCIEITNLLNEAAFQTALKEYHS